VLAGLVLVFAGAVADFAFHLLAPPLPPAVSALLGPDGGHAHLLTLFGMVVAVSGLVVQARTSASLRKELAHADR
jgi:hypothetical protein